MKTVHKLFLSVLGVALLASCSTTNDVISDGSIQKRKYRKGYHVDFRKKTPTDNVAQYDKRSSKPAESSQVETTNFEIEQPETVWNAVEPAATYNSQQAETLITEAGHNETSYAVAQESSHQSAQVYDDQMSTLVGQDDDHGTRVGYERQLGNEWSTTVTSLSDGNLKKTGLTLMVAGLIAAVIGLVLAAGSATAGSAGGFGIGALLSWLGWLVFLIGLIVLIIALVQ